MSITICGQCNKEVREDLIHTCSPQVCPTCGGSGWLYGVRCGTCAPTRPEGLTTSVDRENREKRGPSAPDASETLSPSSVPPEGLDIEAACRDTKHYTFYIPHDLTMHLQRQHRAALDALRARYRQAVEEAYREGWNEFGRSGPTDQSKGDTVEKAWSQSDALAALPEVSE